MGIEVVILLLLLVMAVIAYVRLWRRYQRNIRKVSFMFGALDSGDYSFRFPEEAAKGDELLLNSSLNQVKAILPARTR